MKKSNQSIITSICFQLFFAGLFFSMVACSNGSSEDDSKKTETEENATFQNILWNVKAIQPDGQSLDIKAFDNEGKSYDVMAIQDSDQDYFLNIKAIKNGEEMPVKMLVSDDQFVRVKAIDKKGGLYKIKAITATGEELDVKGVARIGYVVIMKAITKEGDFYPVKAISPSGQLDDVKGIKINFQEREMTFKGHNLLAHVKAMRPAKDEDDYTLLPKKKEIGEYKTDFERIIWNVKAVTKNDEKLDIKAFDAEGNKFDVKALQDSKQHSFMSIKAFVDGNELPIKIMDESTEYAPIKAIGLDGTIYDVKAISEEGKKLDVKGISRSGNIVHVKAINEDGGFYNINAFAPDGEINLVKGIKIFPRRVEMKKQGHDVYAHLKAINQ